MFASLYSHTWAPIGALVLLDKKSWFIYFYFNHSAFFSDCTVWAALFKISGCCSYFVADELDLIFKGLFKSFFNCRNWPTFLIVEISDGASIFFAIATIQFVRFLYKKSTLSSLIACLLRARHSNLDPEALRLLQLLFPKWTIFLGIAG